jgi:hypothetical protein
VSVCCLIKFRYLTHRWISNRQSIYVREAEAFGAYGATVGGVGPMDPCMYTDHVTTLYQYQTLHIFHFLSELLIIVIFNYVYQLHRI